MCICAYKISDYTFMLKTYGNRKDLSAKMQVNSVNLFYFPDGSSKNKTCKGKEQKRKLTYINSLLKLRQLLTVVCKSS